MKNTKFVSLLSSILCFVLIAVMALSATGCNLKNKVIDINATTTTEKAAEKTVLGNGAKVFTFTATDLEGKESIFEIHTDKASVGDALVENDLIAGDQSEYGLYVKTVNGLTLDYAKDGKFWAFYINGEMAQTGVDSTEIAEGSTYSFKPADA